MRALRVVGLGEDGKIVILESDRGERFQIPADERLRAAARGDITRLGQIAIELESQMRPREIQSRIRAGESVEQVAAAAGVPPERVERFAYPVLLERSRTAELAQRAHPVREDGPDVQELGEVVAQAFAARGQDYTAAVWDSWKGEDGKWVVQLTWTAGRSNNHAHWSFHPGAHGGTVTPLDDHALDLLDPNPNRGLRTVRPVTELAAQALQVAEPRRQAVNGGEPPRRVEEQDYVQDFELTDDQAPVGLVEQPELPVEDPYDRPREYRPEQYREPDRYRATPDYRPAEPPRERRTPEPTRQTEREPEPPRQAERPTERAEEPAPQAEHQTERAADPLRQPEHLVERAAEPPSQEEPTAERAAEPSRQEERPAEPPRQAERPVESHAERAAEPSSQPERQPEPAAEPTDQPEPADQPKPAAAAAATPASPPSPPVKEPAQPRSARPTMPAIPEEQAAPAERTSSRPAADTPAPAAASTASPAVRPAVPAEEEPSRSAMPATEETTEETPAAKTEPAPPPPPAAPPRKKGRKARPSVPSWEDVLLGTRSNR
ncbi:septation protein SepH [Actinophytocola glycyrrhizae]|uniref:Septation protein SepH n=1 Tax=Actinophytocola glycyrrhizae TaxID=2044873 RepID=A0ABV9S0Y1_9PSEU